MTEVEAAWLRKLRDEGPQCISLLFSNFCHAKDCLKVGWTFWSGVPTEPESITPEGLAALSEHEGKHP